MEFLELQGKIRTEKGKNAVHRIKKKGLIPGSLNDRDRNTLIMVNPQEVSRILSTAAGNNIVFKFKLEDKEESDCWSIIKEVQYHPISRNMLHIDLMRVSLEKRIVLEVALKTKGMAPGVKEGGIINFLLRKIKISCPPLKIPSHIAVDVSNLHLGAVLHVGDIAVEEETKILTSPEKVVLSIIMPKHEEEKAKEAAPAAAEGETPAAKEE